MARAVTPILPLEAEIETLLTPLGFQIYVETLSDAFDADRVTDPVILIQNGGYKIISQDIGAGEYNSQLMESIWIVSIVCKKAEYLTAGSPLMMDMVGLMKMFKPPNFRKKFRIVEDVKDFARPTFSDRICLYPFHFAIPIVI